MRCRRSATKADAAVLMPREGTARAKERGVRFGCPMKLNAHQRQEALARIAAGEMQNDVARVVICNQSRNHLSIAAKHRRDDMKRTCMLLTVMLLLSSSAGAQEFQHMSASTML